MTPYDIEKCFDSLQAEDCVNPLWCSLHPIYRPHQRPEIVVRTPFGETDPSLISNPARQGTALGPILNNCSLDQVCKEGRGYQNGNIQLKSLDFDDDSQSLFCSLTKWAWHCCSVEPFLHFEDDFVQ